MSPSPKDKYYLQLQRTRKDERDVHKIINYLFLATGR